MKLTITDDALEESKDVIFVGVTIFASILNLLVKMNCLPRVAEQRDAPVHAEQKCRDCGGTGYLVDMEGNEHECLLCQ